MFTNQSAPFTKARFQNKNKKARSIKGGNSVLQKTKALICKRKQNCKDSVAPCKGIQDSLGFWISHRGFRIPGSWFQYLSLELGFWIPVVSGILDSLSRFPDSKDQDSGFHKQKFLGFWILQAKISQIPESRFPYTGRILVVVEIWHHRESGLWWKRFRIWVWSFLKYNCN